MKNRDNLTETWFWTPKGNIYPGEVVVAYVDYDIDGERGVERREAVYRGLNSRSNGVILTYVDPSIISNERTTLRLNRVEKII